MSVKNEVSVSAVKSMVDRLSTHLKSKPLSEAPKRAHVQEAIAVALGWPHWHAAISELKSRETPSSVPKPAKGEWLLPAHLEWGDLGRRDVAINFFNASVDRKKDVEPVSTAKLHKLKSRAFVRVVAVRSESAQLRRAFFQEVFRLNPDRPILFVQGVSALDMPGWKGDFVSQSSLPSLLASASLEELRYVLSESLVKSGDDHDTLWKARAADLMRMVLPEQVRKRDEDGVPITIDSLLLALTFESVTGMVHLEGVDERSKRQFKQYLSSINYSEPSNDKFFAESSSSGMAREQHGYLEMQWPSVLNSGRLFFNVSKLAQRRVLLRLGRENYDAGQKERVEAFVLDWQASNPGGLIVVEGVTLESHLWTLMGLSLDRWLDAGTALWVGSRYRENPSSPGKEIKDFTDYRLFSGRVYGEILFIADKQLPVIES